MAKRKSKSPARIGRPPKDAALPAGFEEIKHLPGFWAGREIGDSITGKMLSMKMKHFDKKGVYPARDIEVFTLETKQGKVEITKSGGLGALLDVPKGAMVFIRYKGLKQIKKGQQPMREYQVAVKK